MDTDKIIISVAFIIVLTAFFFRSEIIEEVNLYNEFNSGNLLEEINFSNYHPLTQQEKAVLLQEHIAKMEGMQDRLSKTLIAKNFADFGEYIAFQKEELLKAEVNLEESSEVISFFTQYGKIIADPQFPKKKLLKFADLIDELFPDPAYVAVYEIGWEDGPVIGMFLSENFPKTEKSHYRRFVNRISREIFKRESISLHVYASDSDEKQIFKSRDMR